MSQIKSGPYLQAVTAAVGVLGGAYIAYQFYQKTRLPKEWKYVGKLKNISMYPIKSCAPVSVEKVELTSIGLKKGWLRDRVLMIVDKANNFISARVYPELLLVDCSIKSCVLSIKHNDMEPLHVNLAEVVSQESTKQATVWSCPVPVYDCGEEASEWFNKLLNRPDNNFRLVYYASYSGRELREHSKAFNYRKDDTGALPDETAFNLVNEASVDDLNKRLKNTKVTPRNFRPNFVVTGPEPYAEDNWKFVKIGDMVFEVIKPCLRCVLTTIDPETGVRNPEHEPVETLKTYRTIKDPKLRRLIGEHPQMGLQMALRSKPSAGRLLALDDSVYVA